MNRKTMRVSEIVADGDRLLLYREEPKSKLGRYHVIADPSVMIRVGDIVEYEPDGVNFGWFIRIVERPSANVCDGGSNGQIG